MSEYVAFIHKDPEHGYVISYPDFSELIAYSAFLEGRPTSRLAD